MEEIKDKIINLEAIEEKQNTKRNDVGRKRVEDLEISDEMRSFAYLLAQGIPPATAGAQVGFSEYQSKRYADLPQIKEERAKFEKLRSQSEIAKWKLYDDQIREEAALKAIRILSTDKIVKGEELIYLKFLLGDVWEKKRIAEGIAIQKEKITATEIETRTKTTPLIENKSSGIQFDMGETEEFKKERKLERERE